MQSWLWVLLSALVVSAKGFQDIGPSSDLWEKLVKEQELDREDIKFILDNAPLDFADSFKDRKFDRPEFPELTQIQKTFAIPPSFKSYYDSKYRKSEGLDRVEENEEVASDPFDGNDEHQSPKKASYVPRMAGISSSRLEEDRLNDIYFTTIVAVSSALAVFGIVGAGFCYHRVRRNSKASEDVDYPAYGVTGPGKESSPTSGTDRKLAQNAQMYHYQHQKQQMIAFDSANGSNGRGNGGVASDCESDDGEEGDYTVYECPGLAPAGEMEVHNPLFQDDPTPKAK